MHNIESGKTKNLRGKTLAELSRVLGAAPEVILGKGSFTEAQLLEAEMLSLWRQLDEAQHTTILALIRGLVGVKAPSPPATTPAPRTARRQPLRQERQAS